MKTTLEEMKLEMENLEKAYHLIDDNVGNYVSVDQIRNSIQLAIVELKGKIDKIEEEIEANEYHEPEFDKYQKMGW
jgi:hypothetical protein